MLILFFLCVNADPCLAKECVCHDTLKKLVEDNEAFVFQPFVHRGSHNEALPSICRVAFADWQ